MGQKNSNADKFSPPDRAKGSDNTGSCTRAKRKEIEKVKERDGKGRKFSHACSPLPSLARTPPGPD